MTARVHLNQCAECGKPTSNLSLICDGCAGEYRTAEQEREAIVTFLLNRAARFKELAEQARQNGVFAEYAGLTSVAVACEHNARDIQRGEHIQAQHQEKI